MTFEELAALKVGLILSDEYINSLRTLIMRGPAALTAYIGIPADHPLAGKGCGDLPIEVHGGLTFSAGGDKFRPEGLWWYGWDYGHAGDASFYDLKYGLIPGAHKWTVAEVHAQLESATSQLLALMGEATK
jgi:hypothetical protein